MKIKAFNFTLFLILFLAVISCKSEDDVFVEAPEAVEQIENSGRVVISNNKGLYKYIRVF